MNLKKLSEAERLEIIRKAVKSIQGNPSPQPSTEEVETESDTGDRNPSNHRGGDVTNDEAENILKRHQGHCQGSILETCDGGDE
tara:strand:- start:514 stop:765 length:252 start_codon:yes stop_codon:yes gene_type:complete